MAVELAAAYVSIIPSTKGIAGQLRDQIGNPAEQEGKKSGSRLGAAMTGFASKALKTGGVAAAAAFTGSLVKGFNRLRDIDDARFKLQGLGHDAGTVDAIMGNALNSVKGTAFGLGEAASVAAGAVAAGVQPGRDLERTLGLTGDAATIAGTSLDEMGLIFGKVAASNRLSMMEVNQMTQRGLPILQMLADEYGVTMEEAGEMVSRGEVDFARFQTAIENNIGGAALTAGESFRGSLANMGAAAGRFGAILLGPVFAAAPAVFANITAAVDTMGERVGPLVERFGEWLPGAFEKMRDVIGPVVATVQGWVSSFGSSTSADGKWIAQTLDSVREVFSTALDAVVGIVSWATGVVTGFWDRFGVHLVSFAVTTWENIKRTVDGALKVVKGIFDVFAGIFTGDWRRAWEGVTSILSGAWDIMRALVSQAINAVSTVIGAAMAAISQLWSGAWSTIGSMLSSAWSAMTSAVATGISNVVEYVAGLPGRAVSALSNLGSSLAGSASEGWQRFRKATVTAVMDLLAYIRELPGRILSNLSNIGSLLASAGRDLIAGFIGGIRDKARDAVQAVRGVVDDAVQGAKNLLGISSPSKVFAEIGRDTGQGLVVGLDAMAKPTMQAARRLAGASVVAPATSVAAPAPRTTAAPVYAGDVTGFGAGGGDLRELVALSERTARAVERSYIVDAETAESARLALRR